MYLMFIPILFLVLLVAVPYVLVGVFQAVVSLVTTLAITSTFLLLLGMLLILGSITAMVS